jgi:DNA-binding GntR family transcriptional regulator
MDEAQPTPSRWVKEPIGRVAAPLRDQVLQVVRQAILDFELRPGQRLIERELTEQLNVSRATVREVVARLAAEGLVTIVPQRGAIVSVITAEESADIYEMRVSLEALAAQRFVERASDEQCRELRAAFEDLRSDHLGRRNLDQVRAKDAIYKVLFEGADSPPLTEILIILQGRVRLLRATSLSAPGRSAEMVEEMQEIVEAIEARDIPRATAASARHVRNAANAAFLRFQDESKTAAEPIG